MFLDSRQSKALLVPDEIKWSSHNINLKWNAYLKLLKQFKAIISWDIPTILSHLAP